ncbi:MAG TPA: hypothetical protein VGG76_02440, partial [Gemmatimonadaceae bacterium]
MARSRITARRRPLPLIGVLATFVGGCAVAPHSGAPAMTSGVESTAFGTLANGQSAHLFTMRNAHGIEVQLTNYGGIITSLKTPDRAGHS